MNKLDGKELIDRKDLIEALNIELVSSGSITYKKILEIIGEAQTYQVPKIIPQPVTPVAYLVDGRMEQGLFFDEASAQNMADTNSGNLVPLYRFYPAAKEAFETDDGKWDGVIRAFWRRIQGYKKCEFNNVKELPDPLPVEFRAHFATALVAAPKELLMQANKDMEIAELKASNNKLLDVVYEASRFSDLCAPNSHITEMLNETIKSTPAHSLTEHDNALIERCKNIVADDSLAITFQSMGAYRSEIIKQICALKGNHG